MSTFKTKLNELEKILEWFEKDNADLNMEVKKIEKGMQLSSELKEELNKIEGKVKVIKAKFK